MSVKLRLFGIGYYIAYQQHSCPVTGGSYQYQDYRIRSCIIFSKPCNRNTWTIKACIQV